MAAIASGCSAIVIVDVFSFSTAVDVATARGASILPYAWRDDSAAAFAKERGALLACEYRTTGGYSLSPSSLTEIEPGTRLVLSSKNGAMLSRQAASLALTLTACLRNAAAVGAFLRAHGGNTAVIGGGERRPDETLRPAWEDLVGAGSVIAELPGPKSPEAAAAVAAFHDAKADLFRRIADCSSGRELTERGFASDIELAAAVGASRSVPRLIGDAFIAERVGAQPGVD